jgi:biopolymer transport protein ExbD
MRMDDGMRGPRPAAMAMPMIWVLVVLLIGAMVLTPSVTGPRFANARTATPVARGAFTVGVDRDGGVWILHAPDPGPIADAALAARLRAGYALRGDPSGVLHLVADRWAPYARVQTVLRAAAEAGVRDVELIVECPRGKESLVRNCQP